MLLPSNLSARVPCNSLGVFQPIEPISGRWIDADVFDRAVVSDALDRRNPVRCDKVGVRLQMVTAGRRCPIDHRCIRGREFDAQHGCAGSLHGLERPESTVSEKFPPVIGPPASCWPMVQLTE
jgi:hypothetical protein